MVFWATLFGTAAATGADYVTGNKVSGWFGEQFKGVAELLKKEDIVDVTGILSKSIGTAPEQPATPATTSSADKPNTLSTLLNTATESITDNSTPGKEEGWLDSIFGGDLDFEDMASQYGIPVAIVGAALASLKFVDTNWALSFAGLGLLAHYTGLTDMAKEYMLGEDQPTLEI